MNGYNLFCEDVKNAFSEYLSSGKLTLKSEKWFKKNYCYEVVLESESTYVVLSVEAAYLLIFIVYKKTLERIQIDDLIKFLYPDLDLNFIKKSYFNHSYFNELRNQGAPISEQTKIAVEHLLLGELSAYAKLIEKHLKGIILDGNYSWIENYIVKNGELNKMPIID